MRRGRGVKRFGILARYTGVAVDRILKWLAAAPGAAVGAFSWQAGLIALAAVVVVGLIGLGAEWQRRKTFVALVNGAADGITVKQEDGRGRRCMTVTIPKAASADRRSRG